MGLLIIYILFSAIFHNKKYLLKNCRNKVTMTNRCSALKYDISLKDVKYLKSPHTHYLSIKCLLWKGLDCQINTINVLCFLKIYLLKLTLSILKIKNIYKWQHTDIHVTYRPTYRDASHQKHIGREFTGWALRCIVQF